MQQRDFEDPYLLALRAELEALEIQASWAFWNQPGAPCPRRVVDRLGVLLDEVAARCPPRRQEAKLLRLPADTLLAWSDVRSPILRALGALARQLRRQSNDAM